MRTQPIDYSPLDKMHHSGWRVFRTAFKGFSIPIFFVVASVCIALAVFTKIIPIPAILLFIYGGVMTVKINAYKDGLWKEFAAANGWLVTNKISDESKLPPSTNYGHSRNYGTVVKAQLGSIVCDIYTYDTTTGAGKNQTTHYFTIANVGLPKDLPHIILNSKKDKADIETRFPNDEKLKLEGDFNDYFKLLVGKGEEVDVLTILTPDVMQTLIDSNADEDIEISGQQLYFILRNDKRDTESIKKLIASVESLSNQIIQNISLEQVKRPTAQTPQPATNVAPDLSRPAEI